MAATICAFLDASVLYPVSLRNLLLRLNFADLYQARWSSDVHDEWIRSVLRDNPQIPASRLASLRAAMDEHSQDSLVTGYKPLIQSLALPDPDDRHVLAAAIVTGAELIVTRNLRDFPSSALDPYHIEAIHPDNFIRHLLDFAPGRVLDVIRSQQITLKNPPISMEKMLELFERLDLVETVAELRRLFDAGFSNI